MLLPAAALPTRSVKQDFYSSGAWTDETTLTFFSRYTFVPRWFFELPLSIYKMKLIRIGKNVSFKRVIIERKVSLNRFAIRLRKEVLPWMDSTKYPWIAERDGVRVAFDRFAQHDSNVSLRDHGALTKSLMSAFKLASFSSTSSFTSDPSWSCHFRVFLSASSASLTAIWWSVRSFVTWLTSRNRWNFLEYLTVLRRCCRGISYAAYHHPSANNSSDSNWSFNWGRSQGFAILDLQGRLTWYQTFLICGVLNFAVESHPQEIGPLKYCAASCNHCFPICFHFQKSICHPWFEFLTEKLAGFFANGPTPSP